jgi:hypothetical protein
LTFTLALSSLFLFSGCTVIGAFFIAKNATCEVEINDKRVKSSCELINGIFFERLTVLKKDSVGMPTEYIVTERFECYNPGVDGTQKYWPDKIHFKKLNGHYKWNADTVNIHFKLNGRSREITSVQKKPDNYNEYFIFKSKKYDTCPISFQKDTWYNVNISDLRLSKVYLYVDKKGNFKVYKFDSGICPI